MLYFCIPLESNSLYPKLIPYQWLNEIRYPVWGKYGGVEQKELYKMQIYYKKKHFFWQKKPRVA